MVGVAFALPLLIFSAIVAFFLFALKLLHFLYLLPHILICCSFCRTVEVSVIDLLVGEVFHYYEIVLEIINRGINLVEKEGHIHIGGFGD